MKHWPAVVRGIVRFIALAVAAAAHASEPYHLEVDVGGRFAPVAAVRAGRVICRDGDRDLPVALPARFRLAGDPRSAAAAFTWLPSYGLVRPKVADAVPASERATLGVVRVIHRLTYPPYPPPLEFFELWRDPPPGPGLLVLAWIVDGVVMQLQVELVSPDRNRQMDIERVFRLSAAEERGRGVALYWTAGKFLPPWVEPKAPEVTAALQGMMLGDTAALRAALDKKQVGKPGSKPRETLVLLASDAGLTPCLDLLLQGGGGLLTRSTAMPALAFAAMRGRTDVLRQNREPGPIDGYSVLMCAGLAMLYGHDEAAALLMARDFKAKPKDLQMVLEIALYTGQLEVAKAAVARGAKVDFASRDFSACLVDQALLGRVAVAAWLLDNKSDPNVAFAGTTPLVAAARRGDPRGVELLLMRGARVDQPDGGGVTPLLAACASGHLEIARALLTAGADPHLSARNDNTCLHAAVAWNDLGLVRQLLDQEVDLTARGSGGVTALGVALQSGFAPVARELARAGARVDLRDTGAAELLQAALVLDVPEVVAAAIAAGWSADTLLAGWAPLAIAQINNARGCQALLRTALKGVAPPPPRLADLAELTTPPVAESFLRPDDPRDPDGRTESKAVEIEVVVTETGKAAFPRLRRCEDPRLAAAALAAVGRWRFKPATIAGAPVCVRVNVPIVFEVDETQAVDVVHLDAPPTVTTFPDTQSHSMSTKELFETGVEIVVSPRGEVERVNVRGNVSAALKDHVTRELGHSIFTPGLRGRRAVRTRMDMPAIFFID